LVIESSSEACRDGRFASPRTILLGFPATKISVHCPSERPRWSLSSGRRPSLRRRRVDLSAWHVIWAYGVSNVLQICGWLGSRDRSGRGGAVLIESYSGAACQGSAGGLRSMENANSSQVGRFPCHVSGHRGGLFAACRDSASTGSRTTATPRLPRADRLRAGAGADILARRPDKYEWASSVGICLSDLPMVAVIRRHRPLSASPSS
jgi:hypothetical protein